MKECAVHKHRDVVPLDVHHVWPLGMGGPDEKWNVIDVCPNGHRRIHDYLRLLIRHKGKVPWISRKFFGHMVRTYGELGYNRMEMGKNK